MSERNEHRGVDDAITRLRHEIDRVDPEDPDGRRHLGELTDRLQARLERREQEPVDQAVREIIESYEARYPQVTLLINDIATRLASMGI